MFHRNSLSYVSLKKSYSLDIIVTNTINNSLVKGTHMNNEIDLRALRDKYQMSRKEFADYFEIPYRTVQDWELGNRSIQPYLYKLMTYKLSTDKLI